MKLNIKPKKNKLISVKFSEEEYQSIKKVAKENHIPIPECVRHLSLIALK